MIVFTGFGRGGKDDARTISYKECRQARSETASRGEGRYANGYKYRSMFGSYARYSCIQITVFQYVACNMIFKGNIHLFKIEVFCVFLIFFRTT